MNSTRQADSAAEAPFALSLDGRRFRFGAVLHGAADHGQFVTLLSRDGRVQLGQVDVVTGRADGTVSGEGALLGLIEPSGLNALGTFPFGAAQIVMAGPAMIELVYAAAGATLNIGSVLGADAVAARLIPQRFNRHTFWCGQSGSGKSYALGVLLEQMLVRTSLPMVIFDPNADFVRLGELSAHGEKAESSEEAALLQSRDIRVLRPVGEGADPLLVRFTELSMPSKAAVLRLDPLTDRAEYNELLHFEQTVGSRSPELIIPRLLQSESPAARSLAARIENLRLIDWEVWAGDNVAVTDVIRQRPDATVLDLGGFNHPDEYLVVALAVLDELWERREERKPVLIVIDEAHNLCSPEHDGPLVVAVRERITQIAAEGRKFGLWLLLSTQRPSKVAAGILSQCDNVAVMRMSSPADLAELAVRFGFAPADMLARTTGFRQGEAFFAGGFVPAPTLATMRTRLTVEGGIDVRVPLRAESAHPR